MRVRRFCLLGLSLLIVNPALLAAQPVGIQSTRVHGAGQSPSPHHHARQAATHISAATLAAIPEWEGSYSVRYVNNFTVPDPSGTNRSTKLETTHGHVRLRFVRKWRQIGEGAGWYFVYQGKAHARASYDASNITSSSCDSYSIRAYGKTTSAFANLEIAPKHYSWFVSEFTVKAITSLPNCSSQFPLKKQTVGDFAGVSSIRLPRRSPVLCGTLDITYIGVGVHHLSVQWMFVPKGQGRQFVPDCVHIVKVKRE
ncbi:MAG: hypothetical protein ACYDG3_01240 [Bacillati bacterium]